MPFEDFLIFQPSQDMIGTPADLGMAYEDVYFSTEDNIQLHGWFVPGRRDVTWLWSHGNAGNISHRLENLLMINQRLGVNVFIFDYRGYGLSTGKPTEQGTYLDVEAALAHIKEMPRVNPEQIVPFGRSLGAAMAIHLATRERVRGIIVESAFTSVAAMAKHTTPWFPVWSLLRTRYDSLARIPRITAPLLVIHGQEDEIVPFKMGRQLYEAAPEPKRFHEIPKSRHNDTYIQGGEPYWQALDEFITKMELNHEL